MAEGIVAGNAVNLKFSTVNEIQEFVWTIMDYNGDTDVVQGRKSVDAKSILGVCSLDMQEHMELRVHNGNFEQLKSRISKFIK